MARRQGREQRARERVAGYAPHGEVGRVARAISQIYDGLALVGFHSYGKDGSRTYKAYLYSSTGPVVWAVVRKGSPDTLVGNAAHSEPVRLQPRRSRFGS